MVKEEKFTFETPSLEIASFGTFVAGASAQEGDGGEDKEEW